MADETVVKNWSPAFPLTVENADGSVTTFEGMTRRDWFAGQVVGGILSGEPADVAYEPEHIAVRAYLIADAMLKARGEG